MALSPHSGVLRALTHTIPHRTLLDPVPLLGLFPCSPYLCEGMKPQQRGLGFGSHSNGFFTKPQPVPYSVAPGMTRDLWLKQAIPHSTPANFYAFTYCMFAVCTPERWPGPHTFRSTQLGTGLRGGGSNNVCKFLPSKQKEGEPYVCGPMGSLRDQRPCPHGRHQQPWNSGAEDEVLTHPLQLPVLGNVSSEF